MNYISLLWSKIFSQNFSQELHWFLTLDCSYHLYLYDFALSKYEQIDQATLIYPSVYTETNICISHLP